MSHCNLQTQFFQRVWQQTLNSVLKQQWAFQSSQCCNSGKNNSFSTHCNHDKHNAELLAQFKCPCLMAHALMLPDVPLVKRKRKRRKKRKNVTPSDVSLVHSLVR